MVNPLLTTERRGFHHEQWKDRARLIRGDAHAVYLAARDRRTPWYAKVLAIAVAAYALSPIDLIPDFLPVIGYLDDIIIVPLGILLVLKLIPAEVMAEHREKAKAAQRQPVSTAAAVAIVIIWVASIALCPWLAYRYFMQLALLRRAARSENRHIPCKQTI